MLCPVLLLRGWWLWLAGLCYSRWWQRLAGLCYSRWWLWLAGLYCSWWWLWLAGLSCSRPLRLATALLLLHNSLQRGGPCCSWWTLDETKHK